MSSDLSIGVGPVVLPKYLDRPTIVTRSGPYRFSFAEFDRWGEPLENLVPRVLAEDLSLLLGTDEVFVLPRQRETSLDRRVAVEVARFDIDAAGQAVLIARWELMGPTGRLLTARTSKVSETAAGPDYDNVAEAMSRALMTLSREIADAIRSGRSVAKGSG